MSIRALACRVLTSVLSLVAIALIGACTCPLRDVVPPKEFADLLLPGQTEAIPVVFATNRSPHTEPPHADPCEHGWYGPMRTSDFHTGIAITEITNEEGSLHPFVSNVTSLGVSTGDLITTAMNQSGSEVIIYVHGFHTTFQEGVATSALIGRLMQAHVVPIAFSWPAGVPAFWLGSAYFAERESADFSVPAFKRLLREICSTKGLTHVHLVGHSTGCWLITRGLEELSMEGFLPGPTDARIGQVILAAADIDLDVFRSRFLPQMNPPLAERISVYISQDDQVLGVSSVLRASVAPRLGQLDFNNAKQQVSEPHFEFIDVTGIRDKPNMGHSYLIASQPVCRDVIAILKGVPASKRRLEPGPVPHSYIMVDDPIAPVDNSDRFYHGPRGR